MYYSDYSNEEQPQIGFPSTKDYRIKKSSQFNYALLLAFFLYCQPIFSKTISLDFNSKNLTTLADEKLPSKLAASSSISLSGPASADVGTFFSYTINFSCPSTSGGDCNNVILIDTIPAGLDFVNATVGTTYNTQTGVWTADLGTVPNGSTVSLTVNVSFPSTTIDGTTVSNFVAAQYTKASTPVSEVSTTVQTTATNGVVLNYDGTGFLQKNKTNVSVASLTAKQRIFYGSQFDQPITDFVLVDTFPAGIIIEGYSFSQLITDPSVVYNAEFLVHNTMTGTDSWISGMTNPLNANLEYNCVDCPTSSPMYNLSSDEYLRGFKLTYPTVPGDGSFHPDHPTHRPSVNITFKYDETISGIPNPVLNDRFTNCAYLDANDFTELVDCARIDIKDLKHQVLTRKKDATNTGPYEPGETVSYRLTLGTILASGYSIVNPTIIDVLPSELEYIGNLTVTTDGDVSNNNGSTSLVPNVTAIPNYQGVSNQTALQFYWTDTTNNGITIAAEANNSITLKYDTRIKLTAADNSTLTNTLTVFDGQVVDNCKGEGTLVQDVNDIDMDGDTNEEFCAASRDIAILYPPGFAGLNSYKEVKGNLDTEFSRFPNKGSVFPGGDIEYKICLENPINLTEVIEEIVVVDVLPHVGDRGVVANDEFRESAWRPVFTSQTLTDLQNFVGGITGATLYFSTECEPCLRPDLGAPTTNNPTCTSPNWSTNPPANLFDICAFKIELGSTFSLSPGASVCMNYNMETPVNVPTDGSIAWNSFGFVGDKASGGTLLSSEPIKVGVSAIEDPCSITAMMTDTTCVENLDASFTTSYQLEINWDSAPVGKDIEVKVNNTLVHTIDPAMISSPHTVSVFVDADGLGRDTIDVAFENQASCSDKITFDSPAPCPSVGSGAIGNRVWLDENADGLQNIGEVGLPNVMVLLYENGSPIDTAMTDINGGYLFKNLLAGTYTVSIAPSSPSTLPNGLVQTTLRNAGGDFGNQMQGTSLTLATDEENLSADFGYNWGDANNNTGNGALGDLVWIDADGNGKKSPSEIGLSGVRVNIFYDSDSDGYIDPLVDSKYLSAVDLRGFTGTGSTLTDAAGRYAFHGLAPSQYVVVIDSTTLPDGVASWTQTADPDERGLAAISPDHQSNAVIIAPGDSYVNIDFGYQPVTPLNSVGNFIWLDANADGMADVAEKGIPGVSVSLLNNEGTIIASTFTDENGVYLFAGLPNGSYGISISDHNNVLSRLVQSADPDAMLDEKSTITLSSGTDNLIQDFGYTPKDQETIDGLVGDVVFLDRNQDNIPDEGEGMEGVSLNLFDVSGTTLLQSTVTDENGNYYFGDLSKTGQFMIQVDTTTLPPRLTNTQDPDGVMDSEVIVDLDVTGPIDLTKDFGYQPTSNPGSIGSLIWEDRNADGDLDAGENGIEGITLDLY